MDFTRWRPRPSLETRIQDLLRRWLCRKVPRPAPGPSLPGPPRLCRKASQHLAGYRSRAGQPVARMNTLDAGRVAGWSLCPKPPVPPKAPATQGPRAQGGGRGQLGAAQNLPGATWAAAFIQVKTGTKLLFPRPQAGSRSSADKVPQGARPVCGEAGPKKRPAPAGSLPPSGEGQASVRTHAHGPPGLTPL